MLAASRDCASLQGLVIARERIGLPTQGARVTQAVSVAAKPAGMAGERHVQALAAHCQVSGEIAPVALAMAKAPPFEVSASKPICRYPLYPHYRGAGDPKAAASYACRP